MPAFYAQSNVFRKRIALVSGHCKQYTVPEIMYHLQMMRPVLIGWNALPEHGGQQFIPPDPCVKIIDEGLYIVRALYIVLVHNETNRKVR